MRAELPDKTQVIAGSATAAAVEIVDPPGGAADSSSAGPDETRSKTTIRLSDGHRQGEIGLFGYETERLRWMQDRALSVDVRFGTASIDRFEGLLCLPGHDCLFDESGQPVIETQEFLRGRSGRQIVSKSRTPLLPVPKAVKRLDVPVLFSGWPSRHWGKFLTRGISRLWAVPGLDLPSEVKLLRSKWARWSETFLRHADMEPDRFVKITEPTRLDEVFVPAPSFVESCRAFDCHFVLPERVAERVCGPRPKLTDQPVYLSRSRLAEKMQRSSGEAALEEALAENGVRIVWPETMSFEDQVRLFNQHSTFIGQIGSAFHSLMFRLPDRPVRTIVFDPVRPHWASFAMVDLLKGVQATYVQVKLIDRTGERTGDLDVGTSIAWLEALSVI